MPANSINQEKVIYFTIQVPKEFSSDLLFQPFNNKELQMAVYHHLNLAVEPTSGPFSGQSFPMKDQAHPISLVKSCSIGDKMQEKDFNKTL